MKCNEIQVERFHKKRYQKAIEQQKWMNAQTL
jgi:hypothetical protein